MTHTVMRTGLLSFVLFSLLTTPVLNADNDAERARLLQQQGKILPLEQVITAAMAIKSGQILETELEEDDGRLVYELEILDDSGQVWEMEFDAATAELIELENED